LSHKDFPIYVVGVNAALKQAAEGRLEGDPQVHRGSDRLHRHRHRPLLLDPRLGADGRRRRHLRQDKTFSWYDNERGYSRRCVELAEKVLEPAALGASG
jgi:glyceraldehyde-3-phosphate dehydrogenase/erythrose-4-phosphate dehydrogenase